MNANLSLHESNLARGILPAISFIPADRTPDPQAGARALQKRRPRRILLADDDRGVREVLGQLLESEHYQVIPAKSGREAATRFVADPPDLVLLDLNMPDEDGWAAFRVMNVTYPMLPVIVITARPNQYARAAELGVDAFMEKPLDLEALLAAIRSLVEESEDERMRRLINPEFQTVLLNHGRPEPGAAQ